MANQPRWESNETPPSTFPDIATQPPANTVAFQSSDIEAQPWERRVATELNQMRGLSTARLAARIEAGQRLYTIHCVPCHAIDGSGLGRVPLRGYPIPPSYHSNRLRNVPLEYFVDVISHGKRRMPSYAEVLTIAERCNIASYVRALQLSQAAPLTELNPKDRANLEDPNHAS